MIDERARIRPHIRIYADGAPLTSPAAPLDAAKEVLIVASPRRRMKQRRFRSIAGALRLRLPAGRS